MMTEQSLSRKAVWIAKQSDQNVDDIHDILLGNITRPWTLVQEVETLSREFDSLADMQKDVTNVR